MIYMKKATIAVALFILFLGSLSCVFAATYTKFSSKFIKNFQDCDKYEETVVSEFENQQFTTTRKILGWRNGMCKYQEVVSSPKDKYQIDCNFTAIQMEDLYNSMRDRSKEPITHELDAYAEVKNPKPNASKYVVVGSTTIKGNKAYITWAKYQNNPYFCKPTKLN